VSVRSEFDVRARIEPIFLKRAVLNLFLTQPLGRDVRGYGRLQKKSRANDVDRRLNYSRDHVMHDVQPWVVGVTLTITLYHIYSNIVNVRYTRYMASQSSFDIESTYDKAEMNNVHQQVEKEIASRFDFKGTPAQIEWMSDKGGFKVIGSNEWQIDAIIDIIRKKLATREMSSKVLDLSKEVHESNMKAWKEVPFKDGLSQDNAKKITKLLKESNPKVKTQIQGEAVRATSASRDELQAVMQTLRDADLDFPLSFTNYR